VRDPQACVPIACPVCGAGSSRHLFSSPDLLVGVAGTFHYVRCGACSTVYQCPRVRDEDLLLCYPRAYFTHEGTPTPYDGQCEQTGSLRARVRRAVLGATDPRKAEGLTTSWIVLGRVLSLIPQVRRRARYGLLDELALPAVDSPACLEVGPGRGDTLLHLRQIGWLACGLDIDPAAAAMASAVSACEVRVGSLAATDFRTGSFHLIYLHHAMEHLPDLGTSLARCYELLASGGRLVLIYPNPEALTVRVYGRFSCVWDPPRHLVLPPMDAIHPMLRRLGFDAVRCRTKAWRAGAYHKVSRAYSAGRSQQALDGSPLTMLDRVFGLAEAALVAAGFALGEEILAVAEKRHAHV
jgi:SAM-dependent methyltransferase